MSDFDQERRNEILDEIIMSRRTVRNFTPDAPARELVLQVIQAGLYAPYARAAVENFEDGYFRRFFVVCNGTGSMSAISSMMNRMVCEKYAQLERQRSGDPSFKERSRSWAQRLKWFKDLDHVPGVTTSPYYILIAEHRGIPDLGQRSLAHCLENMWLKATVLGLAFQITTMASDMGDDEEFCGLLKLEPGEWDLMGCALGYARKSPGPSKRPPVDEVTTWL